MKQVKIHCVDAHSHSTFMPEIIEEMSSFYDVQIDPENPDFLFCGNRKVLGDFYAGHFFYSRACKIHITEECVSPNFCFYDYALGSDHLDFGDRYVRCPEYYPSQIANIVKNWQEVSGDAIKDKKKFCNFIYSHVGVTWTPRQDFFHLLSQYKKIDAAGTLLRNTQDLAVLEKKMGQSGNNWLLNEGWSQHQLSDGSWTKLRYETKRAFIKDYKFTIAFENQSYPGYTTEKILDAFRARTVPIYWGNPRITEDFVLGSFINVHDFDSLEAVAAEVKRLDQDDNAYMAMLNTHPIPEAHRSRNYWGDKRTNFLRSIFGQEPERARRSPQSLWGHYEKHIKNLGYLLAHPGALDFTLDEREQENVKALLEKYGYYETCASTSDGPVSASPYTASDDHQEEAHPPPLEAPPIAKKSFLRKLRHMAKRFRSL